jgi:hypothetical protein
MSVCGKCEASFTNSRDVITCGECTSSFHPACCRVGSVENLRKMGSYRKASWRCDLCVGKTSNVAAAACLEEASSMAGLSRSLAELSNKLDVKFESIESLIVGVQAEVVLLREELNQIRVVNASLKEQCAALQKDNLQLQNQMRDVKLEMNNLQQYTRNNNVEIVGVPFTSGEDIYCLLEKLAGVINVPYERSNISVAHRLPKIRNARFPPIVVQFVSRSSRSMWLEAARRLRGVEARLLHDSFGEEKLFINEHLTAHNKLLLGKARGLVKSKKIAFAWVRDGRVRVRRTADGPVTRVEAVEDLEAFNSIN